MLPILNFVIALVFLFMLFSLFSSWVIEFVFMQINKKGEFMRKQLQKVFNEGTTTDWVDTLYKQPLIDSVLRQNEGRVISRFINSIGKNKRAGSNINPDFFSKAIVALVQDLEGDTLKSKIESMEDSGLKRLLLSVACQQNGTELSIEKLQTEILAWYNSFNKRVSYWFKDVTRKYLFFIGLALAIGFNVDVIKIGDKLWKDTALAESFVIRAEQVVESIEKNGGIESKEAKDGAKKMLQDIQEAGSLPIGWENGEIDWSKIFQNYKWLGYLLSAFVVTLGAPFWFDALRKVLALRSGKTNQ